jgi:hypothetical protein
MKDYLMDLVQHTYDLGCVDLVKVEGTDKATTINGVAADRSVVIHGEFKQPLVEFEGTFGIPSLSILKTILGIEEYKENAEIKVNHDKDKGPVSMTFTNQAGDFTNDYRFMIAEIVEEQIKTPKFKGATWNVELEPTAASIMRLKFQSMAHPEETTFQAKTEDDDLVFYFGDHSTSNGHFVFQHNIGSELKKAWHWPIGHVINILSLPGDKTYKISDQGATEIVVDSGLAVYTYILPAQTK